MQIMYDIDSIKETEKKMLEIVNGIENACKECNRKVDESKEVFDTPTAEIFREKTTELITKSQRTIYNEIIPLINKLDDVIKAYSSTMEQISSSMTGQEN